MDANAELQLLLRYLEAGQRPPVSWSTRVGVAGRDPVAWVWENATSFDIIKLASLAWQLGRKKLLEPARALIEETAVLVPKKRRMAHEKLVIAYDQWYTDVLPIQAVELQLLQVRPWRDPSAKAGRGAAASHSIRELAKAAIAPVKAEDHAVRAVNAASQAIYWNGGDGPTGDETRNVVDVVRRCYEQPTIAGLLAAV